MINAVRGTQDIFAQEAELWRYIEMQAVKIFEQAGFQEIRTPIFEDTALFARAVGDDSDIVSKEMYSFMDRGQRSITLRPEGTAGIMRAFIEKHMDRGSKPLKFWYSGPMFRYERPQSGRYRQFHQIGLEAIGSSSYLLDIEILLLALKLLDALGLKHSCRLCINSLGNDSSRKMFTQALREFLAPLQNSVCSDCQRRFHSNPLRALDCKVEADQYLYKNAPKIKNFFDEESAKIWNQIQQSLINLEIDFEVDESLVRGLDYYSHLVFEIKAENLGAQNTIIGGGRYDKLAESLGGNPSPAVGFALGLERLAALLTNLILSKKSIFIISDDSSAAQKLALQLRKDLDCIIEYDYENSKFKKQLEKAIRKPYAYAIFYLEEERRQNCFGLKDLKNNQDLGSQTYSELIAKLG